MELLTTLPAVLYLGSQSWEKSVPALRGAQGVHQCRVSGLPPSLKAGDLLHYLMEDTDVACLLGSHCLATEWEFPLMPGTIM